MGLECPLTERPAQSKRGTGGFLSDAEAQFV